MRTHLHRALSEDTVKRLKLRSSQTPAHTLAEVKAQTRSAGNDEGDEIAKKAANPPTKQADPMQLWAIRQLVWTCMYEYTDSSKEHQATHEPGNKG